MPESDQVEELLTRCVDGDEAAAARLLEDHRQRLKRMVAVRLDDRISSRLDPSDIVQETMTEAVKRLPDYLRVRPIPFYPWLRQLAAEKLSKAHRFHLHTQRRSLTRENPLTEQLSNASQDLLVKHIIQSQTSAIGSVMREELKLQVRLALAELTPDYREILVLLFLEQLSTAEVSVVLGISAATVRSRQVRALERFGSFIRPYIEGRQP